MIKTKETKMTKVGTIETSAPEVLKDGTYFIQSDVFSFGLSFNLFINFQRNRNVGTFF